MIKEIRKAIKARILEYAPNARVLFVKSKLKNKVKQTVRVLNLQDTNDNLHIVEIVKKYFPDACILSEGNDWVKIAEFRSGCTLPKKEQYVGYERGKALLPAIELDAKYTGQFTSALRHLIDNDTFNITEMYRTGSNNALTFQIQNTETLEIFSGLCDANIKDYSGFKETFTERTRFKAKVLNFTKINGETFVKFTAKNDVVTLTTEEGVHIFDMNNADVRKKFKVMNADYNYHCLSYAMYGAHRLKYHWTCLGNGKPLFEENAWQAGVQGTVNLHHIKVLWGKSAHKSDMEPSNMLTQCMSDDNWYEMLSCVALSDNSHKAKHSQGANTDIRTYRTHQLPWCLRRAENFCKTLNALKVEKRIPFKDHIRSMINPHVKPHLIVNDIIP